MVYELSKYRGVNLGCLTSAPAVVAHEAEPVLCDRWLPITETEFESTCSRKEMKNDLHCQNQSAHLSCFNESFHQ
jgi:hypothetical protein